MLSSFNFCNRYSYVYLVCLVYKVFLYILFNVNFYESFYVSMVLVYKENGGFNVSGFVFKRSLFYIFVIECYRLDNLEREEIYFL